MFLLIGSLMRFCQIWRCMIIYKGARYPLWAISIFPIVLFCTSIGFGALFISFPDGTGATALQGVKPDEGENVQTMHAFVTLSLNALVTILIISRLLIYRSRIVGVLGKKHGTPYTGVIAMIVESQLIVPVFGLVLVVELFADDGEGPGTLVAYQIVSQVQILAPLLQIFRVAQGKAWSNDTFSSITAETTAVVSSEQNAVSTIRFGTLAVQGRIQEDQKTQEASAV